MQKVINVLAVSSAVVSLAVVGIGGYVFVNKDAIIKDATDKALESVLGGLGKSGLPDAGLGANDLAPSAPQASPASPQVSGVPSL